MSLTTDAHRTSGTTRRVAAVCGSVLLVLSVSACGSNGNGNQNASGSAYRQGGPQDGQGGSSGRMPGANGKVAAVDGSTAQVQGTDGQVAVTWDGATTFTKEVSGTLAEVKVGSCVLVDPSGQPTSGSTPATEVTAASVRIIPKTDGSCALRGPGGQGGPDVQGGPGGGPQDDATPPSEGSGGGQRPQVRQFGGAMGEVTALSSGGFTVAAVTPGSDARTSVTVTVGADTTYTRTATGAPTDVKVGVCLTATGTTDQTGAVTARTVNLSQPVDGECGGFRRFGPGNRPGNGASAQAS